MPSLSSRIATNSAATMPEGEAHDMRVRVEAASLLSAKMPQTHSSVSGVATRISLTLYIPLRPSGSARMLPSQGWWLALHFVMLPAASSGIRQEVQTTVVSGATALYFALNEEHL